jgi:hypothetical protein
MNGIPDGRLQFKIQDEEQVFGTNCIMRSFIIGKSKAVPLHTMEALGGEEV